MFLRSAILRGLVPGGGLKVTTKDISLSGLVRNLTNLKLSDSIQHSSIKKFEVNRKLSQQNLDTLYGQKNVFTENDDRIIVNYIEQASRR